MGVWVYTDFHNFMGGYGTGAKKRCRFLQFRAGAGVGVPEGAWEDWAQATIANVDVWHHARLQMLTVDARAMAMVAAQPLTNATMANAHAIRPPPQPHLYSGTPALLMHI